MTDDTHDTETEQPRNVTVHLKHPVDNDTEESARYGDTAESRHIVVEDVIDAHVGEPLNGTRSIAAGAEDTVIFVCADGSRSTFRLGEVIGWESEPVEGGVTEALNEIQRSAEQLCDSFETAQEAAPAKRAARDSFREMQAQKRRLDSPAN